jgi:Rieske Fe-S protein
MPKSHHIDRTDFVNIVLTFLGTVMGAIIGLPAISYIISPAVKTQQKEAWIPVGTLDSYPVGTPTLYSFTRTTVNGWEKTVNSYGAYIVRFSEDQVKVYSNMCTHLSCRVTWKDDVQEYICPCHNAHFSKDGKVTAGPPPAPLVEYETKIEEGTLLIHFTEG